MVLAVDETGRPACVNLLAAPSELWQAGTTAGKSGREQITAEGRGGDDGNRDSIRYAEVV